MEGVSETYHIPIGLQLKGSLDRAALRKALDRIVARNEALRTSFVLVDGEPVQRISPSQDSRFHLVEHDLRGQSDAREELARLTAEEARAGFAPPPNCWISPNDSELAVLTIGPV